MKPVVVLLSGGIDSTTTLAVAKAEDFDVNAISFHYGQRHDIEINAAKQCAAYFHVRKHHIINFDLREIGKSALTSDIEVPKNRLQKSEYRKKKENNVHPCIDFCAQVSDIPVTYVPARNAIFLSFALSYAESIGAENIFMGANAVDYSGYPDCRPEFISAFEKMANLATKVSVEQGLRFKVRTPLINLTKGEIIKKGIKLGVDFSLTWSCYDPQPKRVQSPESRVQGKGKMAKFQTPNSRLQTLYVPCMGCDSCFLRAKGFKEAGIEDPLLLKVKN